METRRDFLTLLSVGAGALPLEQALPEPQAQPSAGVGSLFPFIQGRLPKGLPRLCFLRGEFTDVEEWRRLARGRLRELLHYRPEPCSLDPVTASKETRGDLVREEVAFSVSPGCRAPATVLKRRGLRGKLPALIALHDHGAFYLWGREKLVAKESEHPSLAAHKAQYYAGRSIAADLAEQGYLVVCMDMFYWGERRLLLEADPPEWRERPPGMEESAVRAFNQRSSQMEQLVARTIHAAGFTWPGVMFHDDMRTVDYLLSRPDVDPERVGCVGLSVGGLRACHLAALDSRIRAAVAVGWMTSFPYQLRSHIVNTIGHSMVVPGLYGDLDYPDVALLAAPRPLLVINGSRDTLFHPEGVRAAFRRLRAGYRKAGNERALVTRLYDAPHEFNMTMQQEAWRFLDENVRLARPASRRPGVG